MEARGSSLTERGRGMMTSAGFEFHFKGLEAAFGLNHNPRRMAAYLEDLQHKVPDDGVWRDLAAKLRRTCTAFPKIAEIRQHPDLAPRGNITGFNPVTFVDDDCVIEECVDGTIDTGRGIARCPVCDRGPAGIRRWGGPVRRRTPEEMARRRNERLEIARDPGRRKSHLEVLTDAAAMCSRPLLEGDCTSTEGGA